MVRSTDVLVGLLGGAAFYKWMPIDDLLMRGAGALASVVAYWCILYFRYQMHEYSVSRGWAKGKQMRRG